METPGTPGRVGGQHLSVPGEPHASDIPGFPAGTTAVIITCDDFGECHATNAAIIESMEKGLGIGEYAVGATLQMPAPWAPEAVAYGLSHPEADIGVHLTIECGYGYERMKFRPLCDRSDVPGLYNPDGFFWKSGGEAWAHSNEEEVYRECRAQIEAALAAGLDVTHIDGHGGFQSNYAGYCRVCGALAEEYRLPLRMQPVWRYERAGAMSYRDQVKRRGILACDDDASLGSKKREESFKAFYLRRLSELTPGLTDLYIHPGLPSEELRALDRTKAQQKAEQYDLLVHDRDFGEAVREAVGKNRIRLVNWREIRERQRERMSSGV